MKNGACLLRQDNPDLCVVASWPIRKGSENGSFISISQLLFQKTAYQKEVDNSSYCDPVSKGFASQPLAVLPYELAGYPIDCSLLRNSF